MRRGEIWWDYGPAPPGRRPVVLISRDEAYVFRELVSITPVGRRIRGISTEVPLGPEDGLPTICAVNLDSMTTIPKDTLLRHISSLDFAKTQAVDSAVRFALELKS